MGAPKRRRKPRPQFCRKKSSPCLFCGEKEYIRLDCHRIVPGEEGGNYHHQNTLSLCVVHHREVHAGKIVIKARLQSTFGPVIQCEMDGEEKFIREWGPPGSG